ncbi:CRTAC1 family protein [bacterium]|nr:CRTAC1 family protein [bacterium]
MKNFTKLFLVFSFFFGCAEKQKTETTTETKTVVPLIETAKKPQFVNIAEKAGITAKNINGAEFDKVFLIEATNGGCGFFDFDGDGLLDVYLTNGQLLDNSSKAGNSLYKNNGNGTFTDVSEKSKTNSKKWSMGVCAADYDSDGDLDIYVTNYGENELFQNNGDGTFTEVAKKAGINVGGWSTGAAFGDYDNDGDLDLYVANYVAFNPKTDPKPGEIKFGKWKGIPVIVGPQGLQGEPDYFFENNGDGTFTDKTKEANLVDKNNYYGFSVVWEDLDEDGWLDLYIANDSNPNYVYFNQKNKTFVESGVFSGIAYNEEGKEQAGMGVALDDFDGDKKPDIFVTNFSDDTNTLYKNEGNRLFTDLTYQANLGESSLKYLAWGTDFFDYDNDGDKDIFVSNGHLYPQAEKFDFNTKFLQENQLYENLGNLKFKEVTELVSLQERKSSRGAAFGDFDNDGDVDVLVLNLNDFPNLLQNEGGNTQNWLSVELVGEGKNTFAVGSVVKVETGEIHSRNSVQAGASFISQNDYRLHFGLGTNKEAEKLEVVWASSNKKSSFEKIPANSFVKIFENGKIDIKQR